MSRCEITHIANAGLLLRLGRTAVLIDALHDRQVESWSTVTEQRWQTLRSLLPALGPELIFFTHCHPDHFSPRLTARAMECWPEARLALPEQRFDGQRLLDGRLENMSLPGGTLRFAPLRHEGKAFAKVRHYGCLAEHDGLRVLLAGDCALCEQALADFAGGWGPVDVFIAPFPWLTLPRGRDFVLERIRPKRFVVNHLPFDGEDMYAYRQAAQKAAEKWRGPALTLLTEPFQQVDIE